MISYITLFTSCIVVIIGWFIVHMFALKRELENKKRDIRLGYLIDAYRDLGMAAARKPNSEHLKNLESGFHDVQLFGNTEQLELLDKIYQSHSKSNGSDLEPLLNSLRKELRKLLGQSEAKMPLTFFREDSG